MTTATAEKMSPVETLQGSFVPTRLSFKWWGTRKTLTTAQKETAAGVFDADGDAISSGKQLINTKSEAYKALTATRSRAREYWVNNSLPFPEDGIRMIRSDKIDEYMFELELFSAQLESRVADLQGSWPLILKGAESRLGMLWNPGDYPSIEQLPAMFKIEWDFPSVKPDEQLQVIDPDLYEKERQKMIARFEMATTMAEDMFATELSRLVDHLVERMKPTAEGKRSHFAASNVQNLNEFFATFEDLNLGGNEKLEDLVEKAKQIISGVDVKDIRKDDELKAELSKKLAAVSGDIDGMLVSKPRRKIMD